MAEFDGTKKNFEEVDYLLEIIYKDEYTDVINGQHLNKEQLRKNHAKHFTNSWKKRQRVRQLSPFKWQE